MVAIDAIDNDRRLCDWLYYTDSKAMDFICQSYHELDEYKKSLKTFCGEEVLWDKILKLEYDTEKKFPKQRGENLVLIRQSRGGSRCWRYHGDLPAISGAVE